MRIRSVAVILAVALGAILSAETASAAPRLTTRIAEQQVALWRCQDQRAIPRTQASREPWALPRSSAYRSWVLNLWAQRRSKCITALHARDQALREGRLYELTTRDLYALANVEVKRGGVYSQRWGDASPLLKSLCYEAVGRAFGPNASWARYIVNRESGCNPGAVNTTYSSWSQRAQCIAQMIPAYHRWVDFNRCKTDLRYAVEIFVRLSRGGSSTGPWATY